MYLNHITATSTSWWTPKSPMTNDIAIMDAFNKGKERLRGSPAAISNIMLHNSNAIRLYLRCTFLSETISTEITLISEWATLGGPPSQGSESYPDHLRPMEPMLQHWRQLLRSCFLLSTNLIVLPPSQPALPHPLNLYPRPLSPNT